MSFSRLAPLASLALAILVVACSQPALHGTDLGGRPSPGFTLTDAATGRSVSLSDMRGSVVVLAFLFARCPDVCPLTAEHMSRAMRTLGEDASRVRLVAVSVDPVGDTPEAARAFTAAHGLDGKLAYLVGTRAALAPVWAAYGIGAMESPSGDVGHTDAMYLIDPEGRQRVLMRSSAGPDALVTNIRILLRG